MQKFSGTKEVSSDELTPDDDIYLNPIPGSRFGRIWKTEWLVTESTDRSKLLSGAITFDKTDFWAIVFRTESLRNWQSISKKNPKQLNLFRKQKLWKFIWEQFTGSVWRSVRISLKNWKHELEIFDGMLNWNWPIQECFSIRPDWIWSLEDYWKRWICSKTEFNSFSSTRG